MENQEIIEILEPIIASADKRLSADELDGLTRICKKFKKAKKTEERVKLGAKLLKYLVLIHGLFK